MPDHTRRSRRPWRLVAGVLGAFLLALLLSGCQPYPFSPIKPVGTVARQDDNLHEIVTVIAIGVFVIVEGLIVFSALRFHRRRAGEGEEPRQVFGNTPLEMTWTLIPVVIIALLFTLAVQTLQATAVPSKAPAGAITIDVIGHQWVWEYRYPQYNIDYFQQSQQAVPVDGMHIPINTPVLLNITGYDVQHGWWVPAIAGKNEAIPGHINHQLFQADKPGVYYAVCSYYCGTQHYNMLANVVVESRASFDKWVARMRTPPTIAQPSPVATGGKATPTTATISFKKDIQSIFTAHCASCHLNGVASGGLNLSNYQGLLKGGNVVPGSVIKAGDHAHSILWQIVQPNQPWPGGNRMPLGGAGGYLNDAQIKAIADWIDQGAKNN